MVKFQRTYVNPKDFIKLFYKIPFLVPFWNYQEIKAIFLGFFKGEIINGPDIEEFENNIKKFFGVKHALGTNSGRTAIEVALRAINVKKGEEVIVPSFCCSAIVEPVIRIKGVPVFADIGKDLNISYASIVKNLSAKTKAVIVPHLSGKPVKDFGKIIDLTKNKGIFLIEDSAQAMGAKFKGRYVGTFGDAGILSFGIGKNLMASGGGILLTNSDGLFYRAKRNLLEREEYIKKFLLSLNILFQYRFRKFTLPFFMGLRFLGKKIFGEKDDFLKYRSARISNIDAKLTNYQLCKLDEIVNKRVRNANFIISSFDNTSIFEYPQFSADCIFTKLIVLIKTEDKFIVKRILDLARFLLSCGIEIEWSYIPIHLYVDVKIWLKREDLRYTEYIWEKVLSIPINPHLELKEVLHIIESLKRFNDEEFC